MFSAIPNEGGGIDAGVGIPEWNSKFTREQKTAHTRKVNNIKFRLDVPKQQHKTKNAPSPNETINYSF